jgi:hypothetical protein
MRKLLVTFLIVGSASAACATESSLKLSDMTGATAKADPERGLTQVEEVVRPESLRYDSPAYKRHKEFLKFIDRHYNR